MIKKLDKQNNLKQNQAIKKSNKKKNLFKKHYLTETILYVISWIGSVILSITKINSKIITYIPSQNELIPFVMPILLALIPIIVGIATVVYQLYYNRYTLKDFKDDLKSKFIWLFILSSSELCIVLIFWLTKQSFAVLFFESIFLLCFTIVYFLIFLSRFNKFSIGSYVEQYKNNKFQ